MIDNFKNFAKVTVSTGYDASATSIDLTSGHAANLPTVPFNATWYNSTDYPDPSDDPNREIVRVTAIASDTLTVTRGEEGITATTKNAATKTYKLIAGITAKTINADLLTAFSRAVAGRLTLESGVPVSYTDQTAKTTLYFTPYGDNRITLYDGSGWNILSYSEIALPLGTLTADKNYDVFIYNNAMVPTLELSAAWATDITRTDSLAFQDGVYVKSGAVTRRWLGTIRTTSATTTEDSDAKRYVWNLYSREFRRATKFDVTAHTYNGAAWRYFNGSASNKVELVLGLPTTVNVGLGAEMKSLVANAYVGVAIDADVVPTEPFAIAVGVEAGQVRNLGGMPYGLGIGYHILKLYQYAAAGSPGEFGAGSVAAGYLC
jgi:hypothetical protein